MKRELFIAVLDGTIRIVEAPEGANTIDLLDTRKALQEAATDARAEWISQAITADYVTLVRHEINLVLPLYVPAPYNLPRQLEEAATRRALELWLAKGAR